MKKIILVLMCLGVVGFGLLCSKEQAYAVNITEGFEDVGTVFSYLSTGSVTYDIHNTETSRTGGFSFKAGPSRCGASCFDNHRVDLMYNFTVPTLVSGVGFWAKEGPTGGSAWGGKMKVAHDGIWDLNWWGVIDNNKPITGIWQYKYVPINDLVSELNIRIFDLTSRSTIWLDDIVIGAGTSPVPEPSTYLLLGSGLLGLVVWRRTRERS